MVSVAALWAAHRDGNKDASDLLLLNYAPLVKYYVGRLEVTEFFDSDEMMDLGIRGLREAIEQYIPIPEIRFEEYARYKIESKVLDWIEENDRSYEEWWVDGE